MEHTRTKVIITVLALLLLAAAIFVIANKQESSTGESELGENYYYLADDYVLDGNVIYQAGYYEGILITEDSDYRIFIPVNPDTLERLPSEHFSDGTTLELPDGKVYELHVTDGNYHAEVKEG